MTQTEIYQRCIRELGASQSFEQLRVARRYYELFLKTKPEKRFAYRLYLDETYKEARQRLRL